MVNVLTHILFLNLFLAARGPDVVSGLSGAGSGASSLAVVLLPAAAPRVADHSL